MHSLSIGIDLGSHSTRVGRIDHTGQFQMICEMPSIFAFDQDVGEGEGPLFGKEAFEADSKNIIADANRDQKFAAKHGQFTTSAVAPDEIVPFRCYVNYYRQHQGSYKMTLNNNSQTYALSQQAIIAAILAHLMAQVKKQFKACQEYHVIITVPSFAGDNHRRVILEAAKLFGGFKSVQLLNQTTAALIAYHFDQQQAQRNSRKQANVGDQKQLFGLISFGANSFECSLFHAFDVNDNFSPKLVATAGTTELGSATFTEQLAQRCIDKVEQESNSLGMNVRRQILEKCEEAKKRLSRSTSTTIHLHYPSEKGLKPFEDNLKREDFELLCQSPLAKLGQFLERTFGPYRGRIGRLQLAGEGWRMPALMQMLEPFLAENYVIEKGNFKTAARNWVVKGAAVKAWAMEKRLNKSTGGGQENAPFEDLLYRQVDLTLGEISQNLFQANLQIPTGESARFTLKGEVGKFLLEEDGLQMAQFIVRNDNFGGFRQIAFHVGLNGLLQAQLYNSLGQYGELFDSENWSNLYANDGLLTELRNGLTKLSILPSASANSNERVEVEEKVEEEDKNAPNVDMEVADADIDNTDKQAEHGNVEGVKQTASQESSSTRIYASAVTAEVHPPLPPRGNEEFGTRHEDFQMTPALSASTSEMPSSEVISGEKKVKVSTELAHRIYLHCQEVKADIGKLSSSTKAKKMPKFDLDLRKLDGIYAELTVSKYYCYSWPLYMDFLDEAETVRAKHWAFQNSQRVLEIVRNQWEPSWSWPAFNPGFMTLRLEQDFVDNLHQCADHDLVNVLYAAFMHSIREELKHDKFKEAQELMHLMGDKYTCRYQQIAHE